MDTGRPGKPLPAYGFPEPFARALCSRVDLPAIKTDINRNGCYHKKIKAASKELSGFQRGKGRDGGLRLLDDPVNLARSVLQYKLN
jgi:hypothetical protein